ncbi:porin family protein [Limnobacter parvus]|uniref:Porin family protein n=1 Tax=Limnobacter parvus TaxID=2939690 RepID=A0ABT1XG09_9BURK|nr:porin family protein [Limnobacter parvus]MCR2746210.1 porin family protein [Limnobacter parvus]
MKKLICVAALATAAASPVFAEGPYLGAAYNNLSITDSRIGGVELDVDTLGVVGGYELSPNLAIEGRLLTGVDEETSGPFRAEIDSYIGVNLLGKLPLNNEFSLYGTLGYGLLDANISGPGFNTSDDDGGMSYGGGVMFTTGNVNIRAGYEMLYDKDNIEAEGLNLTATFAF